nr:MAG TPA: hypothetical protein [Caudoviricetes sp.]
MNRTLCAIVAVIIIALAIIFDACIIASYSPTMFLTMSDRILLCAMWSVLFSGIAYGIWDCRAL